MLTNILLIIIIILFSIMILGYKQKHLSTNLQKKQRQEKQDKTGTNKHQIDNHKLAILETFLHKLLLNGILNILEIPFEVRTLSNIYYVTALRHSREHNIDSIPIIQALQMDILQLSSETQKQELQQVYINYC